MPLTLPDFSPQDAQPCSWRDVWQHDKERFCGAVSASGAYALRGIKATKPLWRLRVWLAIPLALLLAIFTMASLAVWLPHHEDDIYHLVLPVILFPLIWAGYVFYALLTAHPRRSALVMLGILTVTATTVIGSIKGLW